MLTPTSKILELRVDERVDADAANAGLERSGRDRDPVANLQRSLLAVKRANLGILNQLRVALAHYSGQIGRRNRDLEIGRVQVAQRVQADASCSECPGVVGRAGTGVGVLVVVVVVWLMLGCSVTVALVGGLRPKVRDLSLLTCITAMSTMTSGRALSRSSTSFSAKRDLIGSSRTTRAFCESNCCTRWTSSTARIAFTTSCSSVGWERLVR